MCDDKICEEIIKIGDDVIIDLENQKEELTNINSTINDINYLNQLTHFKLNNMSFYGCFINLFWKPKKSTRICDNVCVYDNTNLQPKYEHNIQHEDKIYNISHSVDKIYHTTQHINTILTVNKTQLNTIETNINENTFDLLNNKIQFIKR